MCLSQDKEEADYVEWLKGQAELEGKEEVRDMVSMVNQVKEKRRMD